MNNSLSDYSSSILSLSVNPTKMFFGEDGHGISRYDLVRYPALKKLNKHMRTLFWEPETIDMSGERRSFITMTPSEQFIFTSNLQRQILLDSVQGRAPMLVFAPFCTDPTLENCLSTWSFFETIHSESYTHILQAIYPDPSVVVEGIPKIREIADCAHSIEVAYQQAIQNPSHKSLYLALIAATALESIRFYVSFACTFSLAERGLVDGSATIVKLIARDETQHLALVSHILKNLPEDDPTWIKVVKECQTDAVNIFIEAADQEKKWARYLFSSGTMLGLSTEILDQYVDYLLITRMNALGLVDHPKVENPLPWISKYLSSDKLQVAPQEKNLASYMSATTLRNNLSSVDFSRFGFA